MSGPVPAGQAKVWAVAGPVPAVIAPALVALGAAGAAPLRPRGLSPFSPRGGAAPLRAPGPRAPPTPAPLVKLGGWGCCAVAMVTVARRRPRPGAPTAELCSRHPRGGGAGGGASAVGEPGRADRGRYGAPIGDTMAYRGHCGGGGSIGDPALTYWGRYGTLIGACRVAHTGHYGAPIGDLMAYGADLSVTPP